MTHSTSGKRFYFAYDFDIESVSPRHRDDCKQWRKTDTETGWNTLLPSDTGHSLVFVSGRNGKSTICSCWQHISAEGLSHIFSSLATVAAKVQWPCDFFQGDHAQGDRIASWGLKEKINWRVGSLKTGTGSLFSIYSKLLNVLTLFSVCGADRPNLHICWVCHSFNVAWWQNLGEDRKGVLHSRFLLTGENDWGS